MTIVAAWLRRNVTLLSERKASADRLGPTFRLHSENDFRLT
ncbi:hypothetical protein [Novipirellula aureliae]|nr:hypothetical protein [Novipirellula aureliae]